MIPHSDSLKRKGRHQEVKAHCNSFLLYALHSKQVKWVHRCQVFYSTLIEWIDVAAHNPSCYRAGNLDGQEQKKKWVLIFSSLLCQITLRPWEISLHLCVWSHLFTCKTNKTLPFEHKRDMIVYAGQRIAFDEKEFRRSGMYYIFVNWKDILLSGKAKEDKQKERSC